MNTQTQNSTKPINTSILSSLTAAFSFLTSTLLAVSIVKLVAMHSLLVLAHPSTSVLKFLVQHLKQSVMFLQI